MPKRYNKINRIFLAVFLALFLFVLTASSSFISAATIEEQQTELQQQLKSIENKIIQYQSNLKNVQSQKNTLQNRITQYKIKQDSLSLEIDSTSLQILYLKTQITSAQIDLAENKTKIERAQDQLGHILQLIYEMDNRAFFIRLMFSRSFSEIFAQIESYRKIISGLNIMLSEIKILNEQLVQKKQDLLDKEESADALLSLQSLQQQDLADTVIEQNDLLRQTKGKESNYKVILSDSQKQARAIKNRLYQLLEVEKQINFGQAVQIAQWASGLTGVRAALLLSVLTQESNLGRNVGTCNRAGDPPNKSWKVVMHPTRDQPPFATITKALGLNPDITPISCPMRGSNGKQIGWGGAMGPAQFIPSTWIGYKGKVEAITGKTANPWDIRDAFLASAIKLANDGATSKSGEWAAAMRYFSGSTNVKYRFYGDSVVERADAYQEDIDKLNK